MSIIDTEATLHEAHRDNHTHRDVNGGWLRPAVFGAMDGLVSNLALMTGVAGGSVSHQTIVITGLAGLAAGAFSMAAGEYTSVASQRELVQAELDVERRELRKHPQDEERELAALYESRGVDSALAREVAKQLARPRTGPGDTRPRRARHRPRRPALPGRRRRVELRLLRPGRPAPRTAVSARRDRPVARAAARADRALRVRRDRGPGDGSKLVVQRNPAARPRGAAAGVTYLLGSLFGTAVG